MNKEVFFNANIASSKNFKFQIAFSVIQHIKYCKWDINDRVNVMYFNVILMFVIK